MSVIGAIPLLLGDEGYQISRSVRLRSSASAYLSRTFAGAPSSTTKQTFSVWVKRGLLGGQYKLFGGYDGSALSSFSVSFEVNNTFEINFGGSAANLLVTTAVYRDPSAWYHIVVAFDTTQATASNRVQVYFNGTQVTAFGTANYPAQNANIQFALANANNRVGAVFNNSQSLDGYLTEVNFIDGQALTPSSFGETDAITGVWKPKKYTGTYGTNGFFLNFSDPSAATAAAIGKDYSGNGNNWTPNNISVTAGSTYDSMLDVPTLWADGGNGRGNYAVLNPLISSTYQTLTNGNLTSKSNTSTDSGAAYSTFSTGATGKWYMEFVADTSTAAGYPIIGTTLETSNLGNANGAAGIPGQNGGGSCGYRSNGQKYISGFSTAYGNSFATNDVIGVAVDCDNGAVYFSKNGTWQNSGDPTSGATRTGAANTWTGGSTAFYIGVAGYTSGNGANANFGQRPFTYTPPTGFKALNTQNLPEPTIKKGNSFFDVSTWTGNGTSQSIVNSGAMQPDLVWAKQRSSTQWHRLIDAVRGTNKVLYSNDTSAEFTDSTQLTAFNSNGFSVGSEAGWNANAATYVGWQWKEGATQGFDIVTYTGTGTNGQTIAHSLGVTPAMVIYKCRGTPTSVNGNWLVWHKSISQAIQSSTNIVAGSFTGATYLNLTSASGSYGFDNQIGENGKTYVAYVFSEVAGFSRFGSYTGNGSSDGVFVYCGFRPRWIMFKCSSAGDADTTWLVYDTVRDTSNEAIRQLLPNLSNAEITGSGSPMDILSNGFKFRNADANKNGSGRTFIFAAFAEHPFKLSLAR